MRRPRPSHRSQNGWTGGGYDVAALAGDEQPLERHVDPPNVAPCLFDM